MAKAKSKGKSQKNVKAKKKKKVEALGQAHIKATFNNTIVSITDSYGNVISWSTTGKMGFHGARKNTSFAAQVTSKDAATTAKERGLRKVDVFVKGPGTGRVAAVRALQEVGLEVMSIQDNTAIPHNGCRPPKKRRV